MSHIEVAALWCSWRGIWGLEGRHYGLEGVHRGHGPLAGCSPAGTRLGLRGRSGTGKVGGPHSADNCPIAPAELKATGTAHFFNFLLNSTDYRILLKDEDHDRMYVGSKDYVLSLDLHDINREPLIVSCHRRAWVEGGQPGTQGSVLDAGARARWALLVLVGKRWGQVEALVSPGLVSPQIHWPASQQRIEECILSGKNSNVSSQNKPTSGGGGGGWWPALEGDSCPTLEKPSHRSL